MDADLLFSEENRRNPFPIYAQMRAFSPVLKVPPPFDAWLLFDYDSVKRALSDHETFSSQVPAPQWFIFSDPPVHTKLRGLIAKAFTPGTIAALEPRICALSQDLLSGLPESGELDLAADYSIPLAMKVISGMIGISWSGWDRFRRWSDIILRISYSRSGGPEAGKTIADFREVSAEMADYLTGMIEERQGGRHSDLLARLVEAEVDGERLAPHDILAFFQLLIVAGQETTANLINNAVLCLMENPEQLALLRKSPELVPAAIEETLRYRSPIQWMMRTPRHDIEIHGQTIRAGELVLPMIGSANRDEKRFAEPDRFDITREQTQHIAFGHGIHFCLGAALSRMEARIALTDLLACGVPELTGGKRWTPRQALNVYGPASLPVRFSRVRAQAVFSEAAYSAAVH